MLADINSNRPVFYKVTVSVNKHDFSCNTIADPYALICAPNKAK